MAAARLTITGQDVRHSIVIAEPRAVTTITEHKADIEARIARAAAKAGRDPAQVSILGVSKRQPVQKIAAALAAGIITLGENYLQDALEKMPLLGETPCWHFIGHIQSNKTRAIAGHFDWVQSIHDERIARRLSEQRPYHAGELQVCIQVCPQGGSGRGGVQPDAVPALARCIEELPRLRLRGLMIMPLAQRSDEQLRREFRAARQLFDALCDDGHRLDTLSMGMSGDFEIAVSEGSTMVRVGTALFGAREG